MSRREAELDGVHVPTTLQEYCQLNKPQNSTSSYDMGEDILDGDDDYYQDSSDEMESATSDVEADSGMA